jgi:hypothetical protein
LVIQKSYRIDGPAKLTFAYSKEGITLLCVEIPSDPCKKFHFTTRPPAIYFEDLKTSVEKRGDVRHWIALHRRLAFFFHVFHQHQTQQPMAKYGKKAQSKVERAMHERKTGELRSGRSGKKVTSRKQAIAIGLSEARKAGAKVPKKAGKTSTTSTKRTGRPAKKSARKTAKRSTRKTARKSSR